MSTTIQERQLARPPSAALAAGVRLYTRAPITLPWLARTVVPVARELHDDGVARIRLRRGWLHGPHIDLIAHSTDARAVAWDDVRRRLDAGPLDAATALTDEKYLDQAREFGRLEGVEPPYLPMAEHGTVALLGPDEAGPRDPALRGLAALDAVHGALTVPLLDAIGELAREPARGTVRLTEMFLALADSYHLGLGHGIFSFRSHAEAFLAWAKPARDVRPTFVARLERDAAVLRPLVEQRLAGDVSPAAAAWRTAFAYGAGVLDATVTDGKLTLAMLDALHDGLDTAAMGPPTAPASGPTGELPDTDFHRTVQRSGRGAGEQVAAWFASYRTLLNVFYQQLPLLTVSPIQRYYTCWAIAELVDEVLGESWLDRLGRSRLRVLAR
ncbi:hypothetical protein [Dactylosporangium sp. NPDC051484]|uniref:hypothetical protein n=1 Tax=Dactylosporangium sp. NPDC051484 TaxID=3154942 RepID=UPI00344FD68C